jgi:predicted GNAT family N-acyltransferase
MDSRIVNFEGDHAFEIKQVRTSVFVNEQGIDSTIDFDGLDDLASHVLIYSCYNVIATGRILDDGHIGRIAVLKQYRKKGAGTKVMQALIKTAEEQAYSRVYLGSQVHAVGFYEKLGFKVCSDIFVDAGIDHVEMEMLF